MPFYCSFFCLELYFQHHQCVDRISPEFALYVPSTISLQDLPVSKLPQILPLFGYLLSIALIVPIVAVLSVLSIPLQLISSSFLSQNSKEGAKPTIYSFRSWVVLMLEWRWRRLKLLRSEV
jgi:hypothetical protein